jgi:hypothetical protein
MDVKSVSQDSARPEDQPKPQEPVPTHRGVGTWLLWLSIAPVIYVLSVGPVAKLDQALHLDQKAPAVEHIIKTLYSPLMWCAMHSRPFGTALGWYIFALWKIHD